MDVDGAGATKRRRERRLRVMLRHERLTVAMELAAALRHSQDARPNETHNALRGQTTPSSGTRPGLDGVRGAGSGSHGRLRGCRGSPPRAAGPGWWRHPGHGGCAVPPGAVSPSAPEEEGGEVEGEGDGEDGGAENAPHRRHDR